MSPRLRVLLVEDVEDDALLLLRELHRAGFDTQHHRVETSRAMQAALRDGTWDIIIADYSMPHFSGLSALKMMQKSGADIPFILVSGTIGEELAVSAMKAGASDYLMKDDLRRLVPAVARELQEAKNRQARRQAEEELRSLKEFHENIVQNIFDGILVDDGDHILTFINPAGAKLLWRRDLAGVSWRRLAGPAAGAGALVTLAGLVLTGRDGKMVTYVAMVLACAVTLWWQGFGPGRR